MVPYQATYARSIRTLHFPELHTLSFVDLSFELVNEANGYAHGQWGEMSLVHTPILTMNHVATPRYFLSTHLDHVLQCVSASNYLYSTYKPLLMLPVNMSNRAFLGESTWH